MANHLVLKSFIVVMTMNIAACSSFFGSQQGEPEARSSSPSSTGNMPSKANLDNMQAQLDEWQQLKPSLQRLVAIEGELKELVVQLNGMVESQSAQQSPHAVPTALIKAEPVEAVATPAIKQVTQEKPQVAAKLSSPAQSPFAVQLYSLTDKSALGPTWQEMLQKHSEELRNLTPLFNEVMVNGKVFYRVVAGGFSRRSDAESLCLQLKRANTPCFMASNSGTAFL